MIHYRLALKNDAYFIDGKGNGRNWKICAIYHKYDNRFVNWIIEKYGSVDLDLCPVSVFIP